MSTPQEVVEYFLFGSPLVLQIRKRYLQRATPTIGLDTIPQQCQHFNQWLTRLENISGGNG
ncbi:MAG: hypothetical protein V7K32_10375 [Nostoc sp.]|uniref:hypothetical protein n=1 Tax=Nostoc sp. TaxID=1180 RepID=UPI002FFAEECF